MACHVYAMCSPVYCLKGIVRLKITFLSSFPDILHNIYFCVQLKKDIQTGLKQLYDRIVICG